MANENIRSASKALSPLLRRRGTSPAVGTALRRAVQSLDKAMATPEGQAETIHRALAELRGCMVLIHESDRPADQEQLEGAATALSFLAPLEAALPLPAARAPSQSTQAPSVFHTVVPSSLLPPPVSLAQPARTRVERKRRSHNVPALDLGAVEVHLAGLHGSFDALHAVVHGSAHRLVDVDKAANDLHAHLLAIEWLGRERTPAWVKASREAKEPVQRLVASAALVHLEAAGGAERSLTVLERSAQGTDPLAPTAITILQTLTGRHFLACASTVFEKTKSETVRAVLLPLLVERGQLVPEQLLPLVEHANDDVAVEAALAFALVGEAEHGQVLALAAGYAKNPRRANALLFAAAALGSVQALAEIRARLQKPKAADARLDGRLDAGLDARLIDALAIAGDDSDAFLLMDLATLPDADADYLLLSAANLGCAATLRALPSFVDRVPKDVLDEAKRLILGEGQNPPANDHGPSIRLLRGQPWSVPGLVACLETSNETISSQRRLALELRVRTGLRPPLVLPSFASAQTRSKVLAHWSDYFARTSGRLPAGQWYYQGKPAKLARKEMA
jgi:hypothetical protein